MIGMCHCEHIHFVQCKLRETILPFALRLPRTLQVLAMTSYIELWRSPSLFLGKGKAENICLTFGPLSVAYKEIKRCHFIVNVCVFILSSHWG